MPDSKKTKAPEPPVEKPKKSSVLGMVLLVLAFTLVPILLAGVTFQFVLKPMLAKPTVQSVEEKKQEEEAKAKEKEEEIPETAVTIDFEEAQANVVTSDPNGPAPVLIYKMAMAVTGGEEAKKLIEEKKAWFASLFHRLHLNHTRAELNDPAVKDNILKQAKQEANNLLKRLEPSKKNLKVIEVMHTKYAVFDM